MLFKRIQFTSKNVKLRSSLIQLHFHRLFLLVYRSDSGSIIFLFVVKFFFCILFSPFFSLLIQIHYWISVNLVFSAPNLAATLCNNFPSIFMYYIYKMMEKKKYYQIELQSQTIRFHFMFIKHIISPRRRKYFFF